MRDVMRGINQIGQRMASDEGINDRLSAMMGLLFGQRKGRDVMAVGRHLAHMTLTVELESSNAQSVLLR
jgi:hypothetical protein